MQKYIKPNVVKPFRLDVMLCMRCAVLIFLVLLLVPVNLKCLRLLSKRIEKTPSRIIYVLKWTQGHYIFKTMRIGIEEFVNRKCPLMNCYITSNRNLLGDITNFDVLLFDGHDVNKEKARNLPINRTKRQIYVFTSLESSAYYPVPHKRYNGYFNLTWTYKLDSDISFSYILIKNKNSEIIGPRMVMHWMSNKQMLPINDTIRAKLANKKVAAVWFVSNCSPINRRNEVFKSLKQEMINYGMTVDVYGDCGDKKCPSYSITDCAKLIETDYYFNFVFENSNAEDYVTEKLLRALKNYAIPVVFGGANYTRFMPHGAYLDAAKVNPKDLVGQMFKLMNEPDSYYEFFKWHNHYSYHTTAEVPDTDPYCEFCKYVNRMEVEVDSKVTTDFEYWWNPHV